MKGRYDDFIADMAADIEAAAPKADPKEINMNNLGEQMEAAVKRAFESAMKEPKEPAPAEEPKEPTPAKEPEAAEEPEEKKEDM